MAFRVELLNSCTDPIRVPFCFFFGFLGFVAVGVVISPVDLPSSQGAFMAKCELFSRPAAYFY